MATLIVTRGLPGSGKTTWARDQSGYFRVNRDDIRKMLLDTWPYGDSGAEEACTTMTHSAIRTLLYSGYDVICDDTNLDIKHLKPILQIARTAGAEIVVQDFTNVPLVDCILQDSMRPNPVGEEVIIRMWKRYLKPNKEKK